MSTDDDIPSAPLCRVVCAAIRRNGAIVTGVRHRDMVMKLQIVSRQDSALWQSGTEDGFLDNQGFFLTREQAWKVAEAAGQIRQVTGTAGTLYSEDLY